MLIIPFCALFTITELFSMNKINTTRVVPKKRYPSITALQEKGGVVARGPIAAMSLDWRVRIRNLYLIVR